MCCAEVSYLFFFRVKDNTISTVTSTLPGTEQTLDKFRVTEPHVLTGITQILTARQGLQAYSLNLCAWKRFLTFWLTSISTIKLEY